MPDIVELDGSPPRVAIERVVPAVSSARIHGSHAAIEPEPFAAEPAPEPGVVPASQAPTDRARAEPGITPRRADLELAAFVALATSLIGGDVRIGVLCGAFLITAAVCHRVPFSIAQGFVGYRSDMGWPQGVQEDDDVHWQWRKGSRSRQRDA